MSKKIHDPAQKTFDDISSSRYIPAVARNGASNGATTLRLDYVGSHGVLFQGDCLQLLANIREGTIDVAFADPPFNLNKRYDAADFSDKMETEAYRSWCRAWLLEMVRVLRPGGALFLYHWPKWLIDLGAWLNSLPALDYRGWIALKMKSGFPIRGRLHPAHYGLLYYTKRGAKSTFNVVRAKSPTCRHCGKLIRDYGGYRGKFERFEDNNGIPWIQISDFWEDTRPARQDKSRKLQINELPMHVPERAILMSSNRHDIVLDVFGGGGSTYHAAQQYERYWIGCELGNTEAILRRIASLFGYQEPPFPPTRVTACFNEKLRNKFFGRSRAKSTRKITTVEAVLDPVDSMDQLASKSKVLGY